MTGIRKLIKIAAIGGILTVSMGFAVKNKINNNIASTEHYKEALKTLRTHQGAVYLLGEPIKARPVDLDDTNTKNFTKDFSAYYEVPIKGTKKSGVLYFWAVREELNEVLHVNRIELALDDEPNKRLLIKNF